MKGRWIFLAAASLSGILTALVHTYIFIALFLMLLFLSKKKNFSPGQTLLLFSIFLLFLIRSESAEERNTSSLDSRKNVFDIVLLDFKIDGDLLIADGKERTHDEKLKVRYRIQTLKEKNFLELYLKTDIACKVNGSLQQPSSSTNPNGFDYKEYLYHKQTYWTLEVEDFSINSCKPQKNSIPSFFRELRFNGISYVQEHFPEKTAPLAAALLFGESDLMDANVLESYQKLGIVHLLAISGGHVAMLVGMLFFICIRLGLPREKTMTFLILFLPCYALLTGAAPSVVRAVLMLLFILLAKKLGSSLLTHDVISVVFIGYTLFQPYIVFDVGFQLSFAVSLAIILSAPILFKRFVNPLALLFIISFICQLAAAPILFWYFFEVSIISVIANIPFVPLFTVILVPMITLLFFLHLLIGEKIQFILEILNAAIYKMDAAAEKFADFPFAVLILGRPPIFVLFLYLLVIPLFFFLWERRQSCKSFIRVLLLPLFVMILHFFANTLSPSGEIIFIDVGQGDSILIKMPYGKGNYLIDTGGEVSFNNEKWQERQQPFDVGKDIVVPVLKSKGVSTIDKLILTHGDADHIGGAPAVLEELNVKEVIFPMADEQSELEQELINTAKQKAIPIHFAKSGESWDSGDTKFYVLSPEGHAGLERNDGSIVIFTEIGGVRWLFTGDLEENGEGKLMKKYSELKIDVLKVGHHGSNTSTSKEFLDTLLPKIAVISVGENNRYGHPSGEVLNRLEKRNIKIFRTDKFGAITYFFKGDNGTFFEQIP